jgi:hypothetical protein
MTPIKKLGASHELSITNYPLPITHFMSNFVTPLCLKPRFSKRFVLVNLMIHAGAILSLLPLALPLTVFFGLVVKLCLGLLVLISAFYIVRRHLLLLNHPLYGCVLRYDERQHCIRVHLQSGQETQIASGSYSHPQLIVLRLKGIKNALVIFPDALDVQTFRQLRVHLRYADDCSLDN